MNQLCSKLVVPAAVWSLKLCVKQLRKETGFRGKKPSPVHEDRDYLTTGL